MPLLAGESVDQKVLTLHDIREILLKIQKENEHIKMMICEKKCQKEKIQAIFIKSNL